MARRGRQRQHGLLDPARTVAVGAALTATQTSTDPRQLEEFLRPVSVHQGCSP